MSRVIHLLAIALVIVGLAGCGKNPGHLDKAGVEAHLKEVISLKSITLEAKPGGGGFTGNAQSNEGIDYTIDVVQDPSQAQLTYTAKSKDGDDIRTGSLKNK